MTEKEIAKKLHADLKAGKLKKIGADEINAAVLTELVWTGKIGPVEIDGARERVTRHVVELAV